MIYKLIKGKLADIRKEYYKNNIDSYISYLENSKREYIQKAHDSVKSYNKVLIELRNAIASIDGQTQSPAVLALLERTKERLKKMEDGYDDFVAKQRENVVTFDIKLKEMKARQQLITANKLLCSYSDLNLDSFDNDFNEIESLLNEIDIDIEAAIKTEESFRL